MKKEKNIAALVTGALVGVGLGLLFAPKKGSETRKDIKRKYKELSNKVSEIDMEDIEDFIEDAKTEIENELKNLKKEKVLSKAHDKANEIKIRCDEIIEMATAAGNEALENTVKEFKTKTVKALKEVIKKLEA